MHAGTKRSGEAIKDSMEQPPTKKRKMMQEEEEEEDPLEAFMKDINKTAKKQKNKAIKRQKEIESKSISESIKMTQKKEERIDLNAPDTMDAIIEQIQTGDTMFLPSRKGTDGYNSDEEVYNVAKYINKLERDKKDLKNRLKNKKANDLKYDDYDNIITPDKDRIIEDLEPIDHSKIWYPKFRKNFYKQHNDIKNMTDLQVKELRNKYNINCKCNINPIESWPYFGFDEKLLNIIIEQEFIKPTPIQMQSLPILLSGFNVLGLAQTGSGKTCSFIWPIIPHILNQESIEPGYDGPIVIILSPTRELASQTFKECKRYVTPFNFKVAPIYGGLNMFEQGNLLKSGVEIIVATPGRLIDLIKNKNTNCQRVTYIVIDEVDKMFNYGFESQIRSIIGQIRNDKQIAMFSATMNNKIEKIASDVLNNYIRISIGNINESNNNITQCITILSNENSKFEWLKKEIIRFLNSGLCLIFCKSKIKCEQLSRDLNNIDIQSGVIHGDKLQNNRQEILNKFKKEKIKVLVATDIASRGINILNIKTVINYDCPHNMDSYIHRVGRTGRANDKSGFSYTLLIPNGKNDKQMAPKLLNLFKKIRMDIPPKLYDMVNPHQNNNKNENNKTNNNYKKGLESTFVKASDSSFSIKPKKKRKTRWGN